MTCAVGRVAPGGRYEERVASAVGRDRELYTRARPMPSLLPIALSRSAGGCADADVVSHAASRLVRGTRERKSRQLNVFELEG
jgi:hypothetical protein